MVPRRKNVENKGAATEQVALNKWCHPIIIMIIIIITVVIIILILIIMMIIYIYIYM